MSNILPCPCQTLALLPGENFGQMLRVARGTGVVMLEIDWHVFSDLLPFLIHSTRCEFVAVFQNSQRSQKVVNKKELSTRKSCRQYLVLCVYSLKFNIFFLFIPTFQTKMLLQEKLDKFWTLLSLTDSQNLVDKHSWTAAENLQRSHIISFLFDTVHRGEYTHIYKKLRSDLSTECFLFFFCSALLWKQ